MHDPERGLHGAGTMRIASLNVLTNYLRCSDHFGLYSEWG